jgi:hypothetical protein
LRATGRDHHRRDLVVARTTAQRALEVDLAVVVEANAERAVGGQPDVGCTSGRTAR